MAPQDLETWKNVAAGRVVLKQYNQRGELHDVLLAGGKVVHLTPNERRINQELAATDDLDVFKNGFLSPVKLLDDEPDSAVLKANPNVMGEDEMVGLFKAHHKTFEKRIADISSETVLRRLSDLGKAENATFKQLELISSRLAEVAPPLFNDVSTQL